MDRATYDRIYDTRQLPEDRERRIKSFGAVLFTLEILFAIWCLAVEYLSIYKSVALLVAYALAVIIVILFIVTGVMLYRAYYSFWCAPFSLGIPLRLGLVFGGVACVGLFNFPALIFIVVLFAVVIPQQKMQREVFVKTHGQSARGITPYHIVRYEEDGEGKVLSQAPASPGVSTPETVLSPAHTQAVSLVTTGSGRGWCLAIALLVGAAVNILLSSRFVMNMAGSLSSSSSAVRGATAGFGWMLLLPGIVVGAVIFAIAVARVKMLRQYQPSDDSKIGIVYTVVETLAAASVLPFAAFWVCVAIAFGGS